jgi:hypothetical protein
MNLLQIFMLILAFILGFCIRHICTDLFKKTGKLFKKIGNKLDPSTAQVQNHKNNQQKQKNGYQPCIIP